MNDVKVLVRLKCGNYRCDAQVTTTAGLRVSREQEIEIDPDIPENWEFVTSGVVSGTVHLLREHVCPKCRVRVRKR